MDRAEWWLREHDPEYDRYKAGWRHLASGRYVTPDVDALAGDSGFLEGLVVRSEGEWISRLVSPERHCLECGKVFLPYKREHRYCCEKHQHRALMRMRRRRAEA